MPDGSILSSELSSKTWACAVPVIRRTVHAPKTQIPNPFRNECEDLLYIRTPLFCCGTPRMPRFPGTGLLSTVRSFIVVGRFCGPRVRTAAPLRSLTGSRDHRENLPPAESVCVRKTQSVGTEVQAPLHRGRPVTPQECIALPSAVLWCPIY